MNIRVDIKIDGSKHKVWGVITDINNYKNILSGIIDLQILNQPRDGLVGLKWTETRKIFGKESAETMWITDCKNEEYYCTRAENSGAIYTTRMSVSEAGTETLLTLAFSATSDSIFIRVMSSIMGMFIKKPMVKMLEKDLSDIKAFVEKRRV